MLRGIVGDQYEHVQYFIALREELLAKKVE